MRHFGKIDTILLNRNIIIEFFQEATRDKLDLIQISLLKLFSLITIFNDPLKRSDTKKRKVEIDRKKSRIKPLGLNSRPMNREFVIKGRSLKNKNRFSIPFTTFIINIDIILNYNKDDGKSK